MKKNNYHKFSVINLYQTGLFNPNIRKNIVCNRLAKMGIFTLDKLFELYDKNKLAIGNDRSGNNFFIHEEIKGVVNLLRYKFLGEDLLLIKQLSKKYKVSDLEVNLKFGINSINILKNKEAFEFYKLLKSCGFSGSNTIAIISDIKENRIGKISLGEYLLEINGSYLPKFRQSSSYEETIFQRKVRLLSEYYSLKKANHDFGEETYESLINELSILGTLQMYLNLKISKIQDKLEENRSLIETKDEEKKRMESGISFLSEKNLANLTIKEASEIKDCLN